MSKSSNGNTDQQSEIDHTTDSDTPKSGDTVVIRTDDGILRATVDKAVSWDGERPSDGVRMGGVANIDEPCVHYVDYYHADGKHSQPEDAPSIGRLISHLSQSTTEQEVIVSVNGDRYIGTSAGGSMDTNDEHDDYQATVLCDRFVVTLYASHDGHGFFDEMGTVRNTETSDMHSGTVDRVEVI